MKEHESFPYLTMRRLDNNKEEDRKLTEEYWMNV